MKKRTFKGALRSVEHPLIVPNILRQGDVIQHVPVDDTYTVARFVCLSLLTIEASCWTRTSSSRTRLSHPRTRQAVCIRNVKMCIDIVLAQDHMAWKTQGPSQAERSSGWQPLIAALSYTGN
jgi:hypothetical protein